MVAGTPLLVAFFFCFGPMRKMADRLLCFSVLPALFAAFIVPVDISVEVPWFFMGGRMGLDATGRVFLCVTAFIWLLSSWSVRKHFNSADKFARFYVLFLVAMAGNLGLILAQDMLGFYLFFALMSLASYGLIVQDQTVNSRRAGLVYLVWVMISEIALFVALVIVAGRTGSLDFAEIGHSSVGFVTVILLYISFGMKIGAFPLHGWMPLAYQSTPAPAAAVMAGAMVNAGLLGLLRFLPLGNTAFPQAAMFFVAAGSVSTLYGAVMGLGRKKAGQILAYSSMSQMGLMTVIFGLGCLSGEAGRLAIPVLIVFAVHHSLAKSSLFFGIDCTRGKSTSLAVRAGFLLPSLALAGLPLTSGAVAKAGFKDLSFFAGEPWSGVGHILFPLSSIGTTILMLYFSSVALSAKGASDSKHLLRKLIWFISLVAVAGAIWLWPGAQAQAVHSLNAGKIWQSLWPVIVGCFLVLLWKSCCTGKTLAPLFFLRDVFVVSERGIADGADDFFQKLDKGFTEGQLLKKGERTFSSTFAASIKMRLRNSEKVLGRWSVVGFSFVVICLILLFL